MTWTGTKHNEDIKKWRDNKRALGLCIKCGRVPARRNKLMCKRCAVLHAEEQSQFRERMKVWEEKLNGYTRIR